MIHRDSLSSFTCFVRELVLENDSAHLLTIWRHGDGNSLPAGPARPLAPCEMSIGPRLCNLASLRIAPASALARAEPPLAALLLDLLLIAENLLSPSPGTISVAH